MTPKTSALDRSPSTTQLLSALQANPTDPSPGGSFGRVLENSLQPRPADNNQARSQGAERRPEPQTQRGESRSSRSDTDRPPPPAEQSQPARSAEPSSEAKPGERSSQSNNAVAEDGPDAPVETTAMPAQDQDPAKLAVLAAVIAALRGNEAASEAEGEAPLPAVRAAVPGSPNPTLGSDAEGRPDGKPSAGARGASPGAQLAAANPANTSSSEEGTKRLTSLRSVEPAGALQAAAVPARTAPAQAGTLENPAMPTSTAAMGGIRAEPPLTQRMLVPTSAGQRLWADDVANRVIWMAGRGEGRAELILTPPNLGKLGVSIQMSGEQTTAHFVATSAGAREALEQALPRLREALLQAGITLGEASVSTSGEQQARDDGGNTGRGGDRSRPDEYAILPDTDELANDPRWTQVGSNLVDIFA